VNSKKLSPSYNTVFKLRRYRSLVRPRQEEEVSKKEVDSVQRSKFSRTTLHYLTALRPFPPVT